MNKKIFGIKLTTILTALACSAVAFLIWIVAKYNIEYAVDMGDDAAMAFIARINR